LRAIGPPVSNVSESGMMPLLLRRPWVGFKPTMPFTVDGPRIEPPVSVPIPSGAYAAAMPTPVPPDEPAGVRLRSWGFSDCPPSELCEGGEANSDMFIFARMTAPASRSFFTTNASAGGIEPSSRTEPPVVGRSAVL
jgi:hypothetical protein